MHNKNYFGFEFAKIGVVALADVTADIKYRRTLVSNWDVVVNFIYPGCENASQSTYLIFVNEVLKYAGEYTGTFQERWILRRNEQLYLWHSNNDFSIQNLLKSDDPPEISIWLCVEPFLFAPDGSRLNISAALERRIISEHQPEWNKRGRMKPTAGLALREIIGPKGSL
jgi:hypothetical protein